MQNQPLVSVIIPCYNAEKYVKNSIESIINQIYKNLEIIITDDCSTDSTYSILQKLALEDPRIKLFRNEKNLGIVDTLNSMIDKSTGTYIARMDADDVSLPNRILKQVQYLEKHKSIMILGCNVTHINEDGKTIFYPVIPCSTLMVKNMRYFRVCFYHPTVMIRAKIKSEYFYEKEFQFAEDYVLWLKLLELYSGANLKERLLQYRIHNQQISQQKTDRQILLFNSIFKRFNFGVIKEDEVNLYAEYIAANSVRNKKKVLKLIIRFFIKKRIIISPLLFLSVAHKFIKAKQC